MGLGQFLDQAHLVLLEGDEVLDEVEEPRRPARALDQRVEADDALLLLVVDPFPLVEKFERRVGRAEHRLEPVRQDDEGVRREHLRDRRAVVGEIAVVGVGHRLVARLQLDEEKRQAVDEADEVGALGVKLAREPDLRGEKEVVAIRVVPVDDAHGLGDTRAVGRAHLDLDAIADQFVDFAIGANGIDRAALADKLGSGVVERVLREAGVEFLQREPQPCRQDRLAFGGATLGALPGELAHQIGGSPAEFGEEVDRRLLDEIVLGEPAIERRLLLVEEVVGAHGARATACTPPSLRAQRSNPASMQGAVPREFGSSRHAARLAKASLDPLQRRRLT